MTTHELAKAIRLKMRGAVPQHLIDVVPDDMIIMSYVICSRCDAQWVAADMIPEMVAKSTSLDDYVNRTERMRQSLARAKRNASVGGAIWQHGIQAALAVPLPEMCRCGLSERQVA